MTIAEVKAGRLNVKTLKSAYTAFIGQLVNKVNSKQPITTADWTNLVTGYYDPVTLAMNDLGGKIDALPDVMFSANGQAALPPAGQVVDAHGDMWSFGASAGGEDFHVLKNGADFEGNVAVLVTIYNGAIWTRDSLNNWWTQNATGHLVTSLMSPYGTTPLNLRSWNTHDGATVVFSSVSSRPPGSAYVIDMNAAKWEFGGLASNGKDAIILRNGIPFAEPGFTTKPYEAIMIRLKNGVAWLQNAAGSWVYPAT